MTPFSLTGSCIVSWMHKAHHTHTHPCRSFTSKASYKSLFDLDQNILEPKSFRQTLQPGFPSGAHSLRERESPTTPVARHCWVHRPCLSHDWSGHQDLDQWMRGSWNHGKVYGVLLFKELCVFLCVDFGWFWVIQDFPTWTYHSTIKYSNITKHHLYLKVLGLKSTKVQQIFIAFGA